MRLRLSCAFLSPVRRASGGVLRLIPGPSGAAFGGVVGVLGPLLRAVPRIFGRVVRLVSSVPHVLLGASVLA